MTGLIPRENKTALDIRNSLLEFMRETGGGHQYIWHYDGSSYSTKIYSTIYYTGDIIDGREVVYFPKITGGYTILAANTSVTSQNVNYVFAGSPNPGHIGNYYPTASYWVINIPTSWGYIYANSGAHNMNAFYTVTFTRPSRSTWSYELENMVSNFENAFS